MKIRHRIPVRPPTSDPVDARYQAQVDAATTRSERAYRQAQDRLAAAIARAEREARKAARDPRPRSQAVRAWQAAEALVELRREELRRIEAIMKESPQPAHSRGTASYRPVPPPGSIL